ncbi:hypothetical protein [Janthinobacterium sp. 13]|uniref:hypothetical protein n=1 Tax=Janthinobacterium sp. 13 TaxID=2035211 RepID=UPI00117AC892|nr:hypothetical protein [Janthinobacterium sp. 13]
MRIFLTSLVVFLVNFLIFFVIDAWANVELGFGEAVTDTNSLLRNGIAAISVFFGMLSQVLTIQLHNEKGAEVDIVLHLGKVFKSRDFWLAAIISPMVVAVALQATAQQSSLLLVGLIAFQNGFFFRSILKTSKH